MSAVPSPCISICQMSYELAQQCGFEPDTMRSISSHGVCMGCFRTMDEIIAWSTASDTYKQSVWQAIHVRSAHAGQPYPG